MEPKIQSTSWNPQLEKTVLKKWKEEDVYRFAIDRSRPAFVIDTPPPYPSGRPWHIGAAAHYAQIDMIARTARMNGKKVLFPIGIDRNGLPVEIYTEKKYKVRMRQMDRQKFLDLCKGALDDLEAEMIQIMKSMGLSGNFREYYRTDSDEYRALTQSTFIELWKRGLVYLANRPNNYCPDCGTTIADAEIIYFNKAGASFCVPGSHRQPRRRALQEPAGQARYSSAVWQGSADTAAPLCQA
jgi:valyl-tRNA synthetase